MRKTMFAVAVLSLVLAAWVSAEPSMVGYTGLLNVPTADVLSENAYNLAISSSELSDWDDRGYAGNVGFQDGIEAGIFVMRPEEGSGETIVNIKHQFQAPEPGRASLAVGISDLTDEFDTSVYVVGTKPLQGEILGTRMTLHGGFGGGWIDGLFLGIEAELNPSFSAIAEHFNNDVSVGARWHIHDHFTVDGGYMQTDEWALNISYNYPR
ncbi:MAG: hypothetical protein ACLFWB_04870 [Armatimonadota bacterium]